MSSQNQLRIKQIRKKSGSSFGTGIPIGTDGILVDMISGLDLEEEIKLGGNHYVNVFKTKTSTQIREWYFSEARENRTLSQMSQYVTFSASVSIIYAIDTSLGETDNDGSFIEYWEKEVDGQIIRIETGEEDEDAIPGPSIVVREDVPTNEQRIIMSLYKGDLNNNGVLIHQKTICIRESQDGQFAIDEQVDYEGQINNLFEQEEESEG